MSNDNFLFNNQLVNQETRKTLCDSLWNVQKHFRHLSLVFSSSLELRTPTPPSLPSLDEGMCCSSITRSNETWRMIKRGRSLEFLIVFCKVLFSVLVQQQMKLQSCWRYSSKFRDVELI